MSVKALSGFARRHWAWMALIMVLLLVASARFRLRELPLERDEGEYAYAGQLILQGVAPYQEAYNMKLPGTYYAYALIMAVFGQTAAGIHLGLILVTTASSVLIFLLARVILDDLAGAIAGGSLALLSASPSLLGTAAHATHFVVLPVIGGTLLLLKSASGARPWTWFASGLMFGCGFVMKQHAIMFCLFAMAVALWRTLPGQGENRWHGLRSAGWLLAGMALPFLLVVGVAVLNGSFAKFWFWTFTYAAEYVALRDPEGASKIVRESVAGVMIATGGFWVLGVCFGVRFWWEGRLAKHRFLVGALLLASITSVCLGLRFRAHYFLLLLPIVTLLLGIGFSRACHRVRNDRSIEVIVAFAILVGFGGSTMWLLITHGEVWFSLPPDQASRRIYGTDLWVKSREVAEKIRKRTSAGARIAVLGSEPQIYFYAGRRSATGFLYTYGLMERQPYSLRMQDDMIAEIERGRPEYIVYANDELSWLPWPGVEGRIFDWWAGYRARHYDLEGVQSVHYDQPTDADGAGHGTQTLADESNLQVFRRRAATDSGGSDR